MLSCSQCKAATTNQKFCSRRCQSAFQQQRFLTGQMTGPYHLRAQLKRRDGWHCHICQLTEWQQQEVPLVLDHIDGDPYNNQPINLRLICPNCDALTTTYKNRNKGSGRHERRARYHAGLSY